METAWTLELGPGLNSSYYLCDVGQVLSPLNQRVPVCKSMAELMDCHTKSLYFGFRKVQRPIWV